MDFSPSSETREFGSIDETMEDENGKFGWCWDSEGNKVELWEPPPGR